MMKKYASYLVLCVAYMLVSCAHAQEMTEDMLTLCKRAEVEPFIPTLASIERPHPNPLFNAIEMGADGEKLKSLLAGKHPDEIIAPPGITLLAYAAAAGNWPAAKALIEDGADVNLRKPGMVATALESAIFRSKYSIACKLILNKAKLPTLQDDRNDFFRFSRIADLDKHHESGIFVEYLLSNGFEANDMGSPLETPLMGAVALNNIPVVKALLKHGARLDIAKKNGLTVWDVARRKNNPETLKILREAAKQQGVQEPVSR